MHQLMKRTVNERGNTGMAGLRGTRKIRRSTSGKGGAKGALAMEMLNHCLKERGLPSLSA